jgi:DNA-3-methyladenine glycosylase I
LDYHDHEWGVPVHNDRVWYEFLILEGFQAGLSWRTILLKRENFRQAFDLFDPQKIAIYDDNKVGELLSNPGIIRNQSKIRSSILNARAFLNVQSEFGSFDAYIWRFVDGRPKVNAWKSIEEIPARSPESDSLSKDLIQRGFKFVGSTICYAHMQATGMINDHTTGCFRYKELVGQG